MKLLRQTRWKESPLANKYVRICMALKEDVLLVFNQVKKNAEATESECIAVMECTSKDQAIHEYDKRASLIKASTIRYLWSEESKLGIESIDKEHSQFYTLLNELVDHSESASDIAKCPVILANLVKTIKSHIQSEEEQMEEANYPEIEMHKNEHQKFLNELKKILQEGTLDKHGISNLANHIFEALNYHFQCCDKLFTSHLEAMDQLTLNLDVE